ncbi:ABC transporter permease [candidate division KSB1 bacterium]
MDDKKIPKIARGILYLLSRPGNRYGILGDIEEEYSIIYSEKGKIRAHIWIYAQIVVPLFSFLGNYLMWSFIMFRNYLKVALRTMKANKTFSIINIIGLAVGMACFILILMLIQFEYSYDKFHENSENVYRIVFELLNGSFQGNSFYSGSDAPLADVLLSEIPEVKKATKYYSLNQTLLRQGGHDYYESGIYGEQSLFDVFSFDMVYGDITGSLNDPFTVVISERLAEKFFGTDDPLGKTLQWNSHYDLTITGVHKDVPANSHFRFDFIVSMVTRTSLPGLERTLSRWGNMQYKSYVVLHDDVQYKELEEKIRAIVNKHTGEEYNCRYYLQPLGDIHFDTSYNFDTATTIDKDFIYLYLIIAFLILAIACINYTNLSTAQYTTRAREIGIRKVVGAYKRHLFYQYMGESFIYTILSIMVAIIVAVLYLPYFNTLINREITIGVFSITEIVCALGATVILVTFISGSYPAVFASAFSPIKIIKGAPVSGKKNTSLRNPLVVVQFAVSITLIICTIIVFDQLNYVKEKDIGYNRDNVLVVPIRYSDIRNQSMNIKNELLNYPSIKSVSCSHALPLRSSYGGSREFENNNGDKVEMNLSYSFVDQSFLEVYNINIISGRNFSDDFSTDLNSTVILNETAVKKLEWDEPIGRVVENIDGSGYKYVVIGVIEDFHFWTLHNEVDSYGLLLNKPEITRFISVKMTNDNIQNTIGHIESVYKEFISDYPFEYFLYEDNFMNQYQAEQNLGEISLNFAILAVIAASLGLFGLATLTIESRTKEIGIRKVLGSSVTGILLLLSKNFTRCVLVSNVLAWPVSYLIMQKWLENYAYSITMNLKYFLISSVITLIITWITISFHIIKAGHANPVDSLRYE